MAAMSALEHGQARPPNPQRRDPRVHRAILESTVALLEERGYKDLTIEAIAAHAGVGKQTIYRWWPGKADLVMEAYIEVADERVPPPDTGSVQRDLEAILIPVFRQNASFSVGTARANKGMMAEAQLDSTFHATYLALHRAWWKPLRDVLERGIARGELRPDIDPGTIIDLLLGASWYRVLLEHAPLDDHFADQIITTVLSGVRLQRS
jgi:AcrR family transcriptional regulator